MAAAQVRGLPGTCLGSPGRSSRARSTSRATARARRARLRRGEPVRQRALERVPPAVRGGGEGGRGQCDERVHGPERRAGRGQSLAAHGRAPRRRGISRASSSATRTAVVSLGDAPAHAGRPRFGGPGAARRARHGDGHRRGAPSRTCPKRWPRARSTAAHWTRRFAACSRRRFRMGLFESPFVDEAHAAAVLGGPAHREARAARGRAIGGAAAQRGRVLPLVGHIAEIARRHRSAGRRAARDRSARGCSTTRLDETRHDPRRPPCEGRRQECGSSTRRRPHSAA